MLSFLALAHMLDATQWMGWGGLGGMLTFLAPAHMLDSTQWMGWGGLGGMLTFLAPAHMLDATQWMGWVGELQSSYWRCAQCLAVTQRIDIPKILSTRAKGTTKSNSKKSHVYTSLAMAWENTAVPNLCKKTAMVYLCEKDT